VIPRLPAGWIVLLLALGYRVACGSVDETDVNALFDAGNQAYKEKNYQEAAEKFRSILETGIRNGQVEFNLGNAYFRLGQLGRSILHYERAHRLLPRHRDIVQNLKVARKQCEDQMEEEKRNAVVAFFSELSMRYTANEWATFASILLLAVGALITARTFCHGVSTRRRLRHLAVVAAIILVWSGSNAAVQVHRAAQREAIIVKPEVQVYAEPNPGHAQHLFLLHEGSKVRIQRSGGDWTLVQYAAGLRGWCEAAALVEI
jgi:tetratricopeptide (TPR) repeat protein